MLAIVRRLLSQALFMTLIWVTLAGQTTSLGFKPIASEYDKPMDRLIMISSNPNRLHIYNPATSQVQSVTVAQPPLSLAISQDGLYAAVGHDALISYVNLQTAIVEKTFSVPAVASGIAVTSTWIYTLGTYYATPVSVKIATGEVVKNTAAFSMTSGKFNPVVNTIYGTRDGTSPNDIERWNISTGPVTQETDSPYHGDYCIYGPVWFSPDWSRIYTGCGTVFRASTDPQLDMYYMSTIPGMNQISSLDGSAALGKIALLRRSGGCCSNDAIDDGVVHVFDSAYLTPSGKFTLTAFEAAGRTYAPHGRAVFFTANSTEMIVVKQADQTSGLLNDYAVQRIPLTASGDCGAAFATSSVAVPAEGTVGSVKITASAGCTYQATSLASWITIVSGGAGSGEGTLQWSVGANPDSISRTGTIVLPGRIFTITQSAQASSGSSSLHVPGYNAVDVAYAKPIDKLVLVSANPNQLHIFDPTTKTEAIVALNAPPLSLFVQPDGTQAAVGHDGWVTFVDLLSGSVMKVVAVPTDVYRLVLPGNGYVYLFPKAEWGDLFSLNIGSGSVAKTSAIYNGREPRLHANRKHIYVSGQSQSKWDISAGVATRLSNPFNAGCGVAWLTEDGRRMFGACAKAYTTSEVPAEDYQYNGSLSETAQLVWLDESAQLGMIAAIPGGSGNTGSGKAADDTAVQMYNDAFLEYQGSIPLPSFMAGGTAFPAHGKWVFWNKSGTGLYAVVQADGKALLTASTGIVQLALSDVKKPAVAGVTNSASQTVGRIAPGELISIYGSGLGPAAGAVYTLDPVTKTVGTKLGGTEVFLNGQSILVIYASEGLVNAIVPFSLGTSGQVPLQVGVQGVLTPAVTLTMATSAPGLFTMNSSGSGQAIAVNPDGTIADAAHPAARGTYVIMYFTGGGYTSPNGVAGGVAPTTLKRTSQPALVTVGDIPATVSFAGAAPLFIEGAYQLNLRIDERTPVGTQKVILTVGNNSSPDTATIVVK